MEDRHYARFIDTRIQVFPALPEGVEHGNLLHLETVDNVTLITPANVGVDFLGYASQIFDLAHAMDADYTFTARYLGEDGVLLHEGDLDPEAALNAEAEALVDQTLLRELSVKDGGINLDLIPPHEIALLWVHAAKGMLGAAQNYTETPVDLPRETMSMEVKAAGDYESFVLTVQRKGRITPHEARMAAEARLERAEQVMRLALNELEHEEARHVLNDFLAENTSGKASG